MVAHESVKNDKMMSAYMSEFVSFNVLDQDYLDNKNDKQLVICDVEKNNEDKIIKEEEISSEFRDLILAKEKTNKSNPVYSQVFATKHGYLDNLSILDLLFNLGPESVDYLMKLDV